VKGKESQIYVISVLENKMKSIHFSKGILELLNWKSEDFVMEACYNGLPEYKFF
jgi:hypothetical protein